MDQPAKKDKVMAFLEEKEAAFTNYISISEDRDSFVEIIDPKWQGNLPYTLIVKPGGEVVYAHDGIIDPLLVRKTIVKELGRYFADD